MASRLTSIILTFFDAGTVLAALLVVSTSIYAQDYQTELSVALDGTGEFASIQDAIDATKSFPRERIIIRVKDGIYREKVEVFAWNTMVSLIGESREGTIITFNDSFDKVDRGRNSTFHTYTMKVRGNDFHAGNLTIINSSGPAGQAVALHLDADRASFANVSIRGFQDTLYVAGEGSRSYFKDCRIEGSTDFIFGGGTALFENCEIRSLGNSYITAASTSKKQPFGLVFKHCRLTAAPDVNKVYLGRPWREFAKAVFINNELGSHITPEGWHNWGRAASESTAFFAEFGNSGPGSSTEERIPWSKQLSAEAAAAYTLENIFGDWNPSALYGQEAALQILLAGDSTMAEKEADKRPETGWGEMLQPWFDKKTVIVRNHAKNGRSTKTFIEEGRWDALLEQARPSDYVFIQFGHNDQSVKKVGRYTTPDQFRANLVRFVSDVRSRDGKPMSSPRSYAGGSMSKERFTTPMVIIPTWFVKWPKRPTPRSLTWKNPAAHFWLNTALKPLNRCIFSCNPGNSKITLKALRTTPISPPTVHELWPASSFMTSWNRSRSCRAW